MFDVNKIRNDFPMFKSHPNLIYFDNGATTFKPQVMIDSVNDFYTSGTANVHRGDYELSLHADYLYDETRKLTAKFIHAEENEIAFTHNDTASLNQIVYGLSKSHLKKGDVILTSQVEHASNLLPWYRLEKELGIVVEYVPVDKQGRILLDEFKKMMRKEVKVVSLASVSNVLGSEQPIKEITKIAHENGVIVIVDGAQSVPHSPTDVKDLDVDFLTFSAHKMCGPGGVGIIYGKREYMASMEPQLLGGGMNARFHSDGTILLKEGPERFEAGTPNIEGVIGFGATLNYLMDLGMDSIHQYEIGLRKYFKDKMKEIDSIILYNEDNPTGPITFNVKDVFAQDAAGYLANKNIAVRSGNHCAKILHEIIQTDSTIRASLYFYNTKEEVDRFVETVKEINLESAIGIFF